jgi:hypothetical protein
MLLKWSEIAKQIGVSSKVMRRLAKRSGLAVGKKLDAEAFAKWLEEYRATKRRRFGTGTSHDPRPGIIYSLIDPRTGKVRYIGKTGKKLSSRVNRHIKDAAKINRSHLHRWLKTVADAGLRPIASVVQECLPGMMDACEREWIAKGRAKGWDLVNATDGGENGVKAEHVNRRIAKISREAWKRPEYRERHRARMHAIYAARNGMTVEVWRAEQMGKRSTPEGRRQQAENMRIHADRVLMKSLSCVPLTRNGSALVQLGNGVCAVIDIEDWDRVARFRWFHQLHHGKFRAKKKRGGDMLLNRFVLGATSSDRIGYANGNTLDCRKSNLKNLCGFRIAA